MTTVHRVDAANAAGHEWATDHLISDALRMAAAMSSPSVQRAFGFFPLGR